MTTKRRIHVMEKDRTGTYVSKQVFTVDIPFVKKPIQPIVVEVGHMSHNDPVKSVG